MNTHQVQEKSYKKISMITSALAIIGLLACYVFFGSGKKAGWRVKVVNEPLKSQKREVAQELVEFLQGEKEEQPENLLSELRKNFRHIELADEKEITFVSRKKEEESSLFSLDSNGLSEENLKELMKINQSMTLEALGGKLLDSMGGNQLSKKEFESQKSDLPQNTPQDDRRYFFDSTQKGKTVYLTVSLWNELGFLPLSIQSYKSVGLRATAQEDVSFLMESNIMKVRINPLQEKNERQILTNDGQIPTFMMDEIGRSG